MNKRAILRWLGIKPREKSLPTYSVDDLKQIINILFVDDKAVKKANQLKNEGWKNITKIDDVEVLAQKEIRDAHIIFVDIHGVGKKMGFEDEGLGLIVALKHQYPEKKIVLYSAEEVGHVDAFSEALDLVDARLRKGADVYQFATTTERLAKEALCFDNCVLHICEVLNKELKINKSKDEVEQIVKHIYNEDLYKSDSLMAEAFNLQNLGSIANIIRLLFGSIF